MSPPDVGWLKRRTANLARPCVVVTEGAQGIINLKTSGPGVKQTSAEKTITLGEEHTEILPNGLETKVINTTQNTFLVYADHLILPLSTSVGISKKNPTKGKMEMEKKPVGFLVCKM